MSFFSHNYVKYLTEPCHNDIILLVDVDDPARGSFLSQAHLINRPLLTPSANQFVLYPIQNAEIWAFYKKAEASFWMAGEINLQGDAADWATLTNNK
jgi:hypothetical protein